MDTDYQCLQKSIGGCQMNQMKSKKTMCLRNELSKLEGNVTIHDFPNYTGVSSILNKMEQRGEVVHVGWNVMEGIGRPIKIYKVGKLVFVKAKQGPRKKHERPADARIEPWMEIWPEFFRVPEFVVKGRIVNKGLD